MIDVFPLRYGADFAPAVDGSGSTRLLIRLTDYLGEDSEAGRGLRRLLAACGPEGPALNFAEYDWSLNAASAA